MFQITPTVSSWRFVPTRRPMIITGGRFVKRDRQRVKTKRDRFERNASLGHNSDIFAAENRSVGPDADSFSA